MFKNYITTAFRNLVRNKLYSFINIGGLAIGLAAVILISLFVLDELSYDKWLPEGDKVYRLETAMHYPGKPDNIVALSPGPVSPVLVKDYPDDIASATRILSETFSIKQGEAEFRADVRLVDASFFDVFDLEMVAGDRNLFASDHNSIIIDEDMAQKYFGADQSPEQAIGQILNLDSGKLPMKVVAVMKNIPENSHLAIEAIALFDPARYEDQPWMAEWWLSPNLYTYLKLKNAGSAEKIEQNFPAFLDRHATSQQGNRSYERASENLTLSLLPLLDIHLLSKGRFQMKPGGDMVVIYSFSTIALFILVIAGINFINLSTARASGRAKEIALRKVVGASRKLIIIQFLGEAAITVSLALMIALVLVKVALPWFNNFAAKILDMSGFTDPLVQAGLLGLAAIVALGAGARPAFHLSSFKPAEVLHSNKSTAAGPGRLQFTLVTLQFAISIGLIIATVVVFSQIQYASGGANSVDIENKLTIFTLNPNHQQIMAGPIREEVEKLPGVKSTSLSGRFLPLTGFWNSSVRLPGRTDDEKISIEAMPVHFDSLNFYGAELVAGRFFSPAFRGDLPTDAAGQAENTRGGVINETAVSHMGFENAEEAIGKAFQFQDFGGEGYTTITIVGVVEDMNMRSLRDTINPMVFTVQETDLVVLNVELHPDSTAETVAMIDRIWADVIPETPIRSFFMDERFNSLYGADLKRGELFTYFSIFSVLVSLLGLYGLSAFAVERRTKEIGVRKVMGARVFSIVKLLTLQFSKPVLIANLIAWPVAWYFMGDWLSDFAYRIELNPLYFIGAGLLALVLAWVTTAWHAFKLARQNPINALGHE